MNKIPVFVTIGGAYRFAFGRFFGNLGVVWLPALLVMAGAWYFLPHMMLPTTGHMAIKPGMAPAQLSVAMRGMMQVYRAMILFWGVAVLLRAEMMLGLTERALGTAKGPGFVYLSLGRAYWRVAGSYFAVTVILMAVYIVLVIAAVLTGLLGALVVGLGAAAAATAATAAAKSAVGVTAALLIFVLVLIVMGVLTYAAVRLTFFLTVAIVDEGRFDLTTPWRLTRGNFWRIFAVGLAIFVPIAVAAAAIYVPLEFGVLRSFLAHMPEPGSRNPQMMVQAMHELTRGLRETMLARWYIVVPLAFVSSALSYGVAAGASVTAYRALVPKSQPGTVA